MSRIFLGIGIQDYSDGLVDLKGARRSVTALGAWAKAQGYSVKIITDEKGPVTTSGIADVLHPLLGDGGQDRVLIAFAGHGMRRDGSQEFWLLSNWRDADGAVDIAHLRERIVTYLPKQVAIMSDACRTLPPARARFIQGSPVIRFTEYDPAPVERVTYHASVESKAAYSTASDDPNPYCFFSRVMFDTLRGVYANDETSIDEAALRKTLARELPLLASQYGRKQQPDPHGGLFLDPHWSDLTKDMSGLQALDLSDLVDESVPTLSTPEQVNLDDVYVGLIPNTSGVAHSQTLSGSETDVDKVMKRRRDARRRRIRKFENLLFSPPQRLSDAVIHGAKGKTAHLIPGRQPTSPKTSPSLLIETEVGIWIGAAKWRRRSPIFALDGTGSVLLSLSKETKDRELLIETLVTAGLGGRIEDLATLAARARDGKHGDPVLGVIAGYAYLELGAYDDVRRMASYYAEYGQPVPFDIALACRLPLHWTGQGYRIEIPDIPERQSRNAAEEARPFTVMARPACNGVVCGHFPWLRQGWGWLEDTRNDRLKALRDIVGDGLKSAMFTTLSQSSGQALLAHLRETPQ